LPSNNVGVLHKPLKGNIILVNSHTDILELVQCLAAKLIASMDRVVYCRLLNKTSFNHVSISIETLNLSKLLANNIQNTIDNSQCGITISFNIDNEYMVFDFYCDDQEEKYEDVKVKGSPHLAEPLFELIVKLIKVGVFSDDKMLQHCFHSFESKLNIQCIPQIQISTVKVDCGIVIKDFRLTTSVSFKSQEPCSIPTVVLRTMPQLEEGEDANDISLLLATF
jgi:hypothetical protein